MRHHRFGATEHEVPVIGQGTWYIETGDRAHAIATLRAGLDLGMTHIDTAEMYGAGEAEEIVARAIVGRRDEVFLVSKVLPENASIRGTVAACERSLSRLRTDRLDCYLLHWRGPHSLEDTVAGFERLQRGGMILSWGVSNFDVADLDELWSIVGPARIACNQVLYNLQKRSIEHAVLPWCEQHRVSVVGYSPFGHSGSLPSPQTFGGRVLREIATKHNATPRQVALAFLVRRPSLFTIPKASSPEHAAENAGAGDLQLSEREVTLIDQAFPLGVSDRLPVL
jgi:diketogulonate reductase-like aldo/keto reductase